MRVVTIIFLTFLIEIQILAKKLVGIITLLCSLWVGKSIYKNGEKGYKLLKN